LYRANKEKYFRSNSYKGVTEFLNEWEKKSNENKLNSELFMNNFNNDNKAVNNKSMNKLSSASSWGPRRKKKKTKSESNLKSETNEQTIKLYYNEIKQRSIESNKKMLYKRNLEFIFKFVIYILSNIINILSVINYIIQTCFEKKTNQTSQEIMIATGYLEQIFSYYFLCEMLFFIYQKRGHILRYIFSFDFLIDFITIFPPIISVFLDNRLFRFQFIRVLRIFRVFRILRIYKTLKIIQIENTNTTAENEIVPKLNPIKLQFYTILVILFCNFFICAGIILGLNDLISDAFSMPDMNFFDSFYFIIVTSSTLGYGDITPTHPVSRFLIIASLFSLVIIVSNQVSKLSLILRTWGPASVHYNFKDHFILVLDSSINYIYVLLSLQNKYEHTDIIIISKEELNLYSPLFNQHKIQIIHVLDYDLEAFDRANIKNARGILIFTEKVTYLFDQKEKIIDFLLLKLQRFYSYVPIYLQTLFSDRSSFNSNKKLVKLKKIIPIMKIKSLIESKSLFNPGFACFIQNLIFNDTTIPNNYQTYNPLMKNYFFGTENKIVIQKFPEYFYNMQFSEAVYIVYLKSIAEHFVKVQTYNKNLNRAILLIGIMEKSKFIIFDKDEINIFPEKYIIKSKSHGVFISYNDLNYVEKFLEDFKLLKEEKAVWPNFTDNKGKGSKNTQAANLDLLLNEDPENIGKNNFFRRSAKIDTINKSIFKRSHGFVQKRPDLNINTEVLIKEENKSATENKNVYSKLKKKKTLCNGRHSNTNDDKSNNKINNNINNINNSNNHKNANNQSKILNEEDSFENIKDEFCFKKEKTDSVTLRKRSNKYDSEIDFPYEGPKYNNFIDTFLNKYDKNKNNLVDNQLINDFKKQQRFRNFENKSIENTKKKEKIKNPFSNTKPKYFEKVSDRCSFDIGAVKKLRNKRRHKLNSQCNINKKIHSSKKTHFLGNREFCNGSDVLLLNNKQNLNKTDLVVSRKYSIDKFEKLEEEERRSILRNNRSNKKPQDKCYNFNISLKGSKSCSSNISSFSSNNNLNLNNDDNFRLSLNNKNNFLNKDAFLKIHKLRRTFKYKPIDKIDLSTKENQPSSKLLSEQVVDEESKNKIKRISSMIINNKNIEEKINKLNGSKESQSIIINKNNNFTNNSLTKSVSRCNINNNIFDNLPEKSTITNKKTYTHSAQNLLALKNENNSRRHSLALNSNNIGILFKKSFREDSQNIQGTLKFPKTKSEKSLLKIKLSKQKRGSIFHKNDSLLKDLINKEEINSFNSNKTSSNNTNNNNFVTDNNNSRINKNNYYINKMQLINSSESDFQTEQENEKIPKKNKKRGVFYDKTKFKSKNTKRNLDFLNKFEHKYDRSIMEEINKKNEEHYSELSKLVYKFTENEYAFEHRIFEMDKVNAQEIFSDHILIIGYQDALDKFVKLILYHFPHKSICFLGTEEQRNLICIKLLKQYKNVYLFQGDPINPFHLLNAGLNNANHVIILSETIFKKLNEDMTALISSRTIDYYFDLHMIIELWDSKSAKLLGYIPLDKQAKDITNEFYHPLFMSGKLIYLSHLDKLTTLSVTDPNVIETLYQIISVGFRKFVNNFNNKRSDINMRFSRDMPVIITIDLPEDYWGKEYYVLVQDLLTLEKPAIPLGLYISDTLGYHLLDSQGKISLSPKKEFWEIVNSHKRKLINLDSMGKFESAYFDNMKFLRNISYTDKIVLNYVDLNRTHLPIFITNPLPGFILSKDCKVLIMTNYAPNFSKINAFHNEGKKEMNINDMTNVGKGGKIDEMPIDEKIQECQDNYIKLLNTLNKQFSSNYIEALKNAEKIKKENFIFKEKKS